MIYELEKLLLQKVELENCIADLITRKVEGCPLRG